MNNEKSDAKGSATTITAADEQVTLTEERPELSDTLGVNSTILSSVLSAGRQESELSWPSKGVDYYAYIDTNKVFSCDFRKPSDWGKKIITDTLSDMAGAMQKHHLEISQNDISIEGYTGRFAFAAKASGSTAERYADIAP